MKILLCCPLILDKKYGGAKVYMEMAEAYNRIGMDCTILSPNELGDDEITELSLEDKFKKYPKVLKKYLEKNAHKYDVIEYEHEFLPYDRSHFSNKTLMVARSILLVQHLAVINIPRKASILRNVKNLFVGNKRSKLIRKRISLSDETIRNADLVNVTNPDDKSQLVSNGHDENKIFHFPYGISQDRLNEFNNTSSDLPQKKKVAFVGSFDYRKGAQEFPQIVYELINKFSDIEILLLGTKGLFQDAQSVLNFFPKRFHSKINVVPQFDPKELPGYLKDVSIGMFPSHLESFGFGILEMLAAHVPVVAYKTPGPPLMLDENMLVKRGSGYKMAERLIQLLEDDQLLLEERKKAFSIPRKDDFNWDSIAKRTIQTYQNFMAKQNS